MARRKSTILTDGELRLMNILWDKERATVKDVVAALPSPGRPAYSTVLTMLRILEEKGYARHEKQGRAFVYVPVLGRGQARRSAIRRLVNQLFDNSPGSLVLNVIEHDDVDADELARLRERLEATR